MKTSPIAAPASTRHANAAVHAPAHVQTPPAAPGDRCTPSSAAATGRAERDGDLLMRGWAVNTGGSGPPADLRTYAQQSSDSQHAAARAATGIAITSPFGATPVGKFVSIALGVVSGLAWDAGQTQGDSQAACPP